MSASLRSAMLFPAAVKYIEEEYQSNRRLGGIIDRKILSALGAVVLGLLFVAAAAQGPTLAVKQVTTGPKQHFFGYIGHVRTIPWNASGRYIVALETNFQDHMPRPEEAARIVLLDTQRDYALRVVEQTRAWNPQQGTMLYWNPEAPETQFFFNDRDPGTGKIFCVLFDISSGKRVREYRVDDTPVGNSGVAQRGGYYLGINYGRLARLRPVTGYLGAYDWTGDEKHPANDGIFKIDIKTGHKQQIISFRQIADALRPMRPDIDDRALFINHTLNNRAGDRIFFFARADFSDREHRVNVAFTIRPDGAGLTPLEQFIGGHPDWDEGHRMIGAIGNRQVIYDIDRQEVVGALGTPEIIHDPEGDIALSPDGKWFVNGADRQGKNYYTILRRADGFFLRTQPFDRGVWTSGDLRLDPAPLWNRAGTEILVPGIAEDKSRQLWVIRLRP